NAPSHYDAVLLEESQTSIHPTAGLEHDKVRMCIDGPKHSVVRLIHELLPVISAALCGLAHMLRVVERNAGSLHAQDVYADRQAFLGQLARNLRRGHGVTDSQAG